MIIKPVWMILTGAMASLSYAPLFWTPVFFLSGILLCCALYNTKQHGFFLGWFYGFGFFLSSLFWAGNSLFLDVKRFAWLWPFGATALPSFFALYTAVASSALVFFHRRCAFSPIKFGAAFALCFSMAEWMQGHLLTGFPWTVCAAIWVKYLPVAQLASHIGVYGLGLVTWALVGLLSGVALRKTVKDKITLHILAFAVGSMGTLWGWGQRRLALHPTSFHSTTLLRIVQPATSLKKRMDPHFYQKHAHNHLSCLLDLSHTSTKNAPTCTLWPEGSFPWPLDKKSLNQIKALNVSPLLMQSTYQAGPIIYNALLACCTNGSTHCVYAKNHLLPFGEYIPGRLMIDRILPQRFLKKITPGDQDFSPGSGYLTLDMAGCPPFFCLMCYEVIFPRSVKRMDHPRAQWILNPTNDGWFGHSPGPYQHLALAQLRAIEYGLSIVRVAHSGISAVIDPLGRLIHTIPLGQKGVKDVRLPHALPFTPFSRYGHAPYTGLLIFLGLMPYSYGRKKSQK